MPDLAAVEKQYESRERAYLSALRSSASHVELGRLAGEVAAAAASWNAIAYKRYHAASGDERNDLDLLTERTEVLSELWADLHTAHQHQQDVLFSITRSLWGRVTPDLRGVAYSVADSELEVRFLFADEPSAQTLELVSEAETECIADFRQSHEVLYSAKNLPIDEPRHLEVGERWVFLRHESDPSE